MTYYILVVAILFAVSGQLLLKKGMMSLGQIDFTLAGMAGLFLNIFQNIYLFFGLIFFGLSFLTWLYVISRIQLNIAYVIVTGLNLSLVTIFSYLLYKESLSAIQIVGFLLVLGGAGLLLWKA
jgi:multidrug transporter EmrE-like cation transporter